MILYICGKSIKCNAYSQIKPEWIEGACFYLCSAGDYDIPEEELITRLYADIWGSAYTDAIRVIAKREIEKHYNLSDSFGPGFYGMDVRAMQDFSNILDFASMGVRISETSGVMIPVKTCTGMYFIVNDKYQPVYAECIDCYGNKENCRLCEIFMKRNGGIL